MAGVFAAAFFLQLSPFVLTTWQSDGLFSLAKIALGSALGLAVLMSAFRTRVRTAKFLIIFAVFVSLSLELTYFSVSNLSLNTLEFIRILQERTFAGNFIAFYARPLLTSLAFALLIVTALGLVLTIGFDRLATKHFSKRKFAPAAWMSVVVYIAACAANSALLIAAKGTGGGFATWPVNLPSHAIAYAVDRWILHLTPQLPRETVAAKPEQPGLRNIVIVVDESVRGDFLDLNSENGAKTGLSSIDPRIINFGTGSSFANCSTASNESFHFLVRREHFVEDRMTHPTLWQYAHNAGYKTVYIDSQRPLSDPHVDWSDWEKAEIDHSIMTDHVSADLKDRWGSERIAAILRQPGRHLIYINKMGAHFPYEGKYPPSEALYKPHLQQHELGVTESQSYGDDFGSKEFVNSYRNALSWNLRSFFPALLKEDLHDALIVYTSDHGQNLERSPSGRQLTHCTYRQAPSVEGIIPIIAITENQDWSRQLRLMASQNRNMYSHFAIPMTILKAMGYSQLPSMSSSLLDAPAGEQTFSSGYFLSFGARPIWRPIEPQNGRTKI